MVECFLATREGDAPYFRRLAWRDSCGYQLGAVEAMGDMLRGVAVESHQNSTDTTQSLYDWLSSDPLMSDIRPRTLNVAQYYPRIHRPCSTRFYYEIATYPEIIEKSAVAVEILIQRMDQLFRVVEPDTENLKAFGHEIRNLLLLACMEVEAAWAAILRANGYPGDRWCTRDYIKLIGPLHLLEYEVTLTSYPRARLLGPFAKWDNTEPTQSLDWYDAYNKTKHDRELAFNVGTLGHAINAVAAAVILFYAQFGQTYYEDDLFEIKRRFKEFQVTKWPTYAPEEWYVRHESGTWSPVNSHFR